MFCLMFLYHAFSLNFFFFFCFVCAGDPSEKPYDKPDPQTLAFLKEENLAPMSSYLEMTTSNAFIK